MSMQVLMQVNANEEEEDTNASANASVKASEKYNTVIFFKKKTYKNLYVITIDRSKFIYFFFLKIKIKIKKIYSINLEKIASVLRSTLRSTICNTLTFTDDSKIHSLQKKK
ncbi:hypothetical protein RFI_33846 [Reticulomyxa filosa]|uniref:Uncharacterized protein n=1 Tax=Reticulomyxa filosa TaxID=46433 RepID=X6LS26_RETFI|nr:hypothetical protein RFI_33846 [Reticulomyxa filosa]|eukprot:ETO03555.1 hypothetical protein RFI_33846 [Reticulomyxa filosa]